MKNWKRKLPYVFAGFVCLVTTGYATRNFWQEQYRIYVLGSIDVRGRIKTSQQRSNQNQPV